MNLTFRTLLQIGLLFCLVLYTGTGGEAWAAKKKSKNAPSQPNYKYASIVIDASTGMVLSQENADRSLHPASLTKIMTMALVFDALRSGKITQKTRLVASSHGASMPPSKVGLKPGQSITVHDALRVLATKSANDVAATVAENLGGSESRFAQMMNLKARSIGMTGTRFVNASGLHDVRQVSTARDMARLAKYLIETYPEYYSIFGLTRYQYGGKTLHNHNRLMSTYQGMDGIKTGYVAASGFNLVASARRGNVRLIGVVFGGRTTASRNSHMSDLLDRGFQRYGEIRSAGYKKVDGAISPASVIAANENIPVPVRKPASWGAVPQASTMEIAKTSEPMAQIVPQPAMKTLQVTPPQIAGQNVLGQIVTPAHKPESATPASALAPSGEWQIQIGAYEDRSMTNKALYEAMLQLPRSLNKGKTLVVPLRTADARWVFRARLSGYTRDEAEQACAHLKSRSKDCLPIAP